MNDRIITTERLILHPYYAGMVTDDHVCWLNDPEVVKYSEQRHRKHTLESVQQYVNNLWTESGSFIWSITALSISNDSPKACNAIKPTLIGTITAHIDKPNGIANIGILIGEKSMWGNGFGAEAWAGVCNWLFSRNIRKIEAGCHYENKPMRRLAKLCGMELEAVVHDHFVVDGKPQHLFLYGKIRPQEGSAESHESAASEPLWWSSGE